MMGPFIGMARAGEYHANATATATGNDNDNGNQCYVIAAI
jgi:hypothetical protein